MVDVVRTAAVAYSCLANNQCKKLNWGGYGFKCKEQASRDANCGRCWETKNSSAAPMFWLIFHIRCKELSSWLCARHQIARIDGKYSVVAKKLVNLLSEKILERANKLVMVVCIYFSLLIYNPIW